LNKSEPYLFYFSELNQMIRLTKLTDYGLVVLTHFANALDRKVWNARDVAQEVHLPVPTVSKLLKAFARGGLLKAHRGVHGGYSLVKKPEAVTLPEIVEILEGPVAITECQEGGGDTSCLLQSLCPLRPTWAELNETVRQSLQNVTLADLARNAAGHQRKVQSRIQHNLASAKEGVSAGDDKKPAGSIATIEHSRSSKKNF
jgi:FeS assembly SUF system regulator